MSTARIQHAGPPIGDVRHWEDVVSQAFVPVEIDPGGQGFLGSIRTFESDGLAISRVATTKHTLTTVEPHAEGRMVLCLHVAGPPSLVVQNGRAAALGPGDATIYDTSRPLTVVHDGSFTGLSVVIPAAAVSLNSRLLESLIAVPLPAADPVTAMVFGVTRSVERGLANLPPVAHRYIARTFLDTFELFCLHHAARMGISPGDERGDQFTAILRYLDDHLSDPDLSPPTIAAAHYMSVRSLHTLTHLNGLSIANWVRRRRLQRCRADLANPAFADLSVSAIGARWGLVSASHFSTLFRAEFGVTPSAYRKSVASSS